MFPQRSLIISAFARPDEYSIAIASGDEYELFSYETLDQCLTEVRAWSKSRAQKEVEGTSATISRQQMPRPAKFENGLIKSGQSTTTLNAMKND